MHGIKLYQPKILELHKMIGILLNLFVIVYFMEPLENKR